MSSLGQQVIGDFFGCSPDKLDDASFLEQGLLQIATQIGATIIQATFHHFSPHGVSGVIVIQESHLALHTWPEGGYAAVDIFTCGPQVNPMDALPLIQDLLGAQTYRHQIFERGQLTELPPMPLVEAATRIPPRPQIQRTHWFTSRSHETALSVKLQGMRIYGAQSDKQRIEVYDSPAIGRFLALDGHIVISTGDEHIYHEMLVRIPRHVQGPADRVLVLGGGDGGVVRELLRPPASGSIQLIEWDPMVPQVVERFFPELARGLGVPQVTLIHAEVWAWLSDQAHETWDLIVMDLGLETSPPEIDDILVQVQQVKQHLTPTGIFALAGPAPRQAPMLLQNWMQALQQVFGPSQVNIALSHLPTSPGGQMSLLFASPGLVDFSEPIFPVHRDQYQIYHAALHRAAFVLPNDVQAMLSRGKG